MRHTHKRINFLPRISNSNKKGLDYRHVIAKFVKDGREYYLHATKGYRSFKI